MERELAMQQSRKIGTDVVNVVREYWEVVILKGLFESAYGKDIVFKGGTALRLVYGSPRFSVDMDFSLIKDTLKNKFCSLVKHIVSPFPELAITDCAEKYYTYLAEIKVTVDYLDMPFRIKIEISKRLQKNYKWDLKLIVSPVINIQVLAQVAILDQLYRDKLNCIKERAKSKDVFDLWYITQQLKLPFKPRVIQIPKKILTRDLRKYLPRNFWPINEKLKNENL